jgi:glycyl-tRNA synthetase beta chain
MQFFLEILTDEIPALDQLKIKEISLADYSQFSNNQGYDIFITPRRVVFYNTFPTSILLDGKIVRGPAITAPQKAMDGFLESNKITKEQTYEENGYYYYTKPAKEVLTKDILAKDIIPNLLENISKSWSKAMPFNGSQKQWIRPIRSFLCIFDGEVVNFEFAGIKSGNTTSGNRFYAPEEFSVTSFEEYRAKLKQAYVILDDKERCNIIQDQIDEICKVYNVEYDGDQKLIVENSMLCEWPQLLPLQIEPEVLNAKTNKGSVKILDDLIIETIKTNQRYLMFKNKDGSLSNICAIVSNNPFTDQGRTKNNIINGNVKVLNARLTDARFFIEQDFEKPLASRYEYLKSLQFISNLGSVYDRLERIKSIALQINTKSCLSLSQEQIKTCISLLKSDLTTQSVKEFDSLQGKIGAFIAKHEGCNQDIIEAISNQYNNNIKLSKFSLLIKLSENIEKIYAHFAVGNIPTSSKDPFALKRAADIVVSIILDQGYVHNKNQEGFNISLQEVVLICDLAFGNLNDIVSDKNILHNQIYEFFYQRFAAFFAGKEVRETSLKTKSLYYKGKTLLSLMWLGHYFAVNKKLHIFERGLNLLKSQGVDFYNIVDCKELKNTNNCPYSNALINCIKDHKLQIVYLQSLGVKGANVILRSNELDDVKFIHQEVTDEVCQIGNATQYCYDDNGNVNTEFLPDFLNEHIYINKDIKELPKSLEEFFDNVQLNALSDGLKKEKINIILAACQPFMVFIL